MGKFFEHKKFTGKKIMEWLPSSPELNSIKNLWSIMKMKLYKGGKQYNSKVDIWNAMKTFIEEIEPAEVKKLKSINRLLAVIEKDHYIKM